MEVIVHRFHFLKCPFKLRNLILNISHFLQLKLDYKLQETGGEEVNQWLKAAHAVRSSKMGMPFKLTIQIKMGWMDAYVFARHPQHGA